jgi:hypothetical protein
LKISIDNKEAIASLQLTDENIKEIYKSFKYGRQEVNGLTTTISQCVSVELPTFPIQYERKVFKPQKIDYDLYKIRVR